MIDAQYKEKMKRVVDSIRGSVNNLVKSNSVNMKGVLQLVLDRLTVLENNVEREGNNSND